LFQQLLVHIQKTITTMI